MVIGGERSLAADALWDCSARRKVPSRHEPAELSQHTVAGFAPASGLRSATKPPSVAHGSSLRPQPEEEAVYEESKRRDMRLSLAA